MSKVECYDGASWSPLAFEDWANALFSRALTGTTNQINVTGGLNPTLALANPMILSGSSAAGIIQLTNSGSFGGIGVYALNSHTSNASAAIYGKNQTNANGSAIKAENSGTTNTGAALLASNASSGSGKSIYAANSNTSNTGDVIYAQNDSTSSGSPRSVHAVNAGTNNYGTAILAENASPYGKAIDTIGGIYQNGVLLVSAVNGTSPVNASTVSGVVTLSLNNELTALSGASTNGLIARTGTATYTARTITGGSGVNVTNGSGVSGDPTLALSPLDQLPAPTAALSLNSQKITNLATPTTSTDAASRGYVLGLKPTDLTAPTSSFSMNSQKITSLLDPTLAQDAATKNYVDTNTYDISTGTTGSLPIARLAGYPADATKVLFGNGTWGVPSASGTVTSVGLSAITAGLSVSGSPITSSGTFSLSLSPRLVSLIGVSATGFITYNSSSQGFSSRSLTAGAGVVITNGNGVSGTLTTIATDEASIIPYEIQSDPTYSSTGRIYWSSSNYWRVEGASVWPSFSGSLYAYRGPSDSNGSVSSAPRVLYVVGPIVCSSTIYAASSKKIKQIDRAVELTELEQKFKQIKFWEYFYKDSITNGTAKSYGVMAEELNQIFPEFVNMEEMEFVPNFMRFSTNAVLSGNDLSLEFMDGLPDMGENVESVKIYAGSYPCVGKIISIQSGHISLIIEEDDTDKIQKQIQEDGKIFIYGTYETCPAVTKEKFFEAGMSLLQNLINRVEELEKKAA